MSGLIADIVKQLTPDNVSSHLLKAREGIIAVHSYFPWSQVKFTLSQSVSLAFMRKPVGCFGDRPCGFDCLPMRGLRLQI